MNPRNRVYFAASFLLLLLASGTSYYSLAEGWSVLDALYMTVIIITTIGFKEVHRLSMQGQIFTIGFSLLSYLFLAGVISIMSSLLMDAYFNRQRSYRKMLRKISQFRNHTVICGEGNVVRYVIDEVIRRNQNFVFCGSEAECTRLEELYGGDRSASRLIHSVIGDPSEEDVLKKAGISGASALICCMGDDSQNLFIAISARNINQDIRISSYVANESNIRKFNLAGIQDAVSGDFIIGRRLASSLEDRNIPLFLDQVVRKSVEAGERSSKLSDAVRGKDPGSIRFTDVAVPADSALSGKSIADAEIARRIGLLVIAVRTADSDEFLFNPGPGYVIHAGDVLIALGNRDQIKNLREYVERPAGK